MKKQLLFLLICLLSHSSYSQISYEKGYFIGNDNQKEEVLIKNIDWLLNPTEFDYKLSENSEPRTATIKEIKEFGVYENSKYVRHTLKMDRSSLFLKDMSYKKEPIFNEEELFLKVLVEGKFNLYEYAEGTLRRYFYSKESSDVEQLIFKNYKVNENIIGKNKMFQQQLKNDMKCPDFSNRKFENLVYNKNDLVKIFVDYSECNNIDLTNYEPKRQKDFFNLTIRPRLNRSSLSMSNIVRSDARDIEFGNKTGIGFGLEAEFILPFNKNKWAVSIEPTYQSYKTEQIGSTELNAGRIVTAEVEYKSVEFPISLRHYFFLNPDSKIFINGSAIYSYTFGSSVRFTSSDGNNNIRPLEIDGRINFAIGLGYKLYDKFSIETRYQLSRELLGDYINQESGYKTISLIIGYTVF